MSDKKPSITQEAIDFMRNQPNPNSIEEKIKSVFVPDFYTDQEKIDYLKREVYCFQQAIYTELSEAYSNCISSAIDDIRFGVLTGHETESEFCIHVLREQRNLNEQRIRELKQLKEQQTSLDNRISALEEKLGVLPNI